MAKTIHGLDDFFRKDMRSRYAEEHVSPFYDIGQCPLYFIPVCHGSQFCLDRIESVHTFVESTAAVYHGYILCTCPDEEPADGSTGCTGTVNDDFGRFHVFSNATEGSDSAGQGSNSCTMLIIVEYGDVHFFFQCIFNFIAFR